MRPPRLAQHPVADVVSERVVHPLEVVDVDDGCRQRRTRGQRAVQSEKRRFERPAVGEPVSGSSSGTCSSSSACSRKPVGFDAGTFDLRIASAG